MDFLDSLDLVTTSNKTQKKYHRVRSWYLYEQYKSLEKNQLDATQRLKSKSYQDKMLREELKERRARRRLCDQFGLCQSEPRLQSTIQNATSKEPLSNDDFFESLCELHEEHESDDFEDNFSDDGSQTSKNFNEFRNMDNKRDGSDRESVNSVIKNVNLADDVKGELDTVKKNITENINLQQQLKENIECLEKYTKFGVNDKAPEIDSHDLLEQYESDVSVIKCDKKEYHPKDEKRYLSSWASFVAFAYKTVQLNHGHNLQPYVAPVKYATSESDISDESYKSIKSCICSKKCYKIPKCPKRQPCNKIKKPCRKLRWLLDRDYHSENKWQDHSKSSFDSRFMKICGASEPLKCVSKSSAKSSTTSLWPQELLRDKFSEDFCKCRCVKKVANPIEELARYIECILDDVQH